MDDVMNESINEMRDDESMMMNKWMMNDEWWYDMMMNMNKWINK